MDRLQRRLRELADDSNVVLWWDATEMPLAKLAITQSSVWRYWHLLAVAVAVGLLSVFVVR